MIWLSTVWDSHSTQLQGPTGRFDGQFIKLKICFQPGVSCHIHVIFMSYPYHVHVIFMSYPHHIHIISTSYPPHIHVISMSYPCHIYVISMSYQCHIHVISFSLPCHCPQFPNFLLLLLKDSLMYLNLLSDNKIKKIMCNFIVLLIVQQ